jgi:DNA-binding CsgD family transcriptional regulator
MASAPTSLIGRGPEIGALHELVESARAGVSGVLVLHGQAGVGKSALVRSVIDDAADFRVMEIAGVESELTLGFAALHRLLVPLFDDIDTLPAAQRRAIETTFGLHAGGAPDRFLVSLATLTLVADAASGQPTLVVIDDAQWIDRESLEVISFVGRRLQADRVVMLIVIRDPLDGRVALPEGLAHRQLVGLGPDDARQLLAVHAPGSVADAVAARVASETAGLPLAIIELAGELSVEQLAGHNTLPTALPVGARLERHFLAQVHALTDDAATLLLVAAAEPTGDRTLVTTAARALGVDSDAADLAERSGLLAFDPVVTFRHPLIRSAVYKAASTSQRRRVHGALADATDAAVDPDRRAWHRAAAASGPDEEVAAELVRCADVARARGGYAAEAALRTRAAELTPDARERGRRYLAAGQAHLTGGAPNMVSEMLQLAQPLLDAPVDRAEALRLEATRDFLTMPGGVAAPLVSAARMLEPIDPRAARDVYAEAIAAVLVSFQLTKGTTAAEVAEAALRVPRPRDDEPSLIDLLLDGFATRLAVGFAEAVPRLRAALDALAAGADATDNLERWALLLNYFGMELWEERSTYQLLRQVEAHDRATGALDTLRVRLEGLGHHEMWRARFASADECHAECVDISVAMGGDPTAWRLNSVELRGWQGDDATTRRMAELLLSSLIEAVGPGVIVNVARMGLIVLDLAQGRYREALDTAWSLYEIDPVCQGNQVLPEVVEAAVRCGEPEAAAAAVARLRERATVVSTSWALGLLARSEALIADDADAEKLYREALEHLGATEIVTELARTHLLFGEWLRRQRQRTEAREHLRTALELFETMGAQAFARRAATELGATGERARRRTVDTANDLTPQEAQVARYAAGGATNAEIAAQLFLSPATVEYHLRKVYRKLGIASRRELVRARFGDPSSA